jgi:hypothetical protein
MPQVPALSQLIVGGSPGYWSPMTEIYGITN